MWETSYDEFPYGLAVRIPGFHPGGPGSTPGMGKNAFLFRFNNSGFSVVYSYVRFLGKQVVVFTAIFNNNNDDNNDNDKLLKYFINFITILFR